MTNLRPLAIAGLAVAPALLTGLLLAAHEIAEAEVTRPHGTVPAPRPVSLPGGPDLGRSRAGQRFTLVAEASRAGFESVDEWVGIRAPTHPLRGHIEFDGDGHPTELEVALDLRGLRDHLAPVHPDLVWNLLSAREDSSTRLFSDVIRVGHTAIPQVVELEALGSVALHGRVHVMQLELQMAQTAPGRVRLQAIGELDIRDFGLPQAYCGWLIPVDPRVTVWIDLVFARPGAGAEPK